MHQKGLNYYFISQKASASGELRPWDPYHVLYFSEIKHFPDMNLFNIDFSWMWAIKHGLEPCIL